MGRKIKSKSTIPNWKKKKWYEIVSPSVFGEKVVGESFCEDPQSMIGKVVKVNLMNLMENSRKQTMSVKIRVVRVNDNKGFTKPIKFEMLPATIRRLVRSGRDRIDLSFTATSKDGAILRFKPLIVTKSNICSSTRTDVRKVAEDFLTNFANENNFESVFAEVARANLQRSFRKALSKVTPLKLVEIRVLEIDLKKGVRLLPEGTKIASSDKKINVDESKKTESVNDSLKITSEEEKSENAESKTTEEAKEKEDKSEKKTKKKADSEEEVGESTEELIVEDKKAE